MHHLSCSPQTTIFLVLDGSCRDEQVTYGWVFGNDNREIYVDHSGAGACSPTSHRAEAWGMLSGLTFLYHLLRYTNGGAEALISQIPLVVVSDNNGLVTRIQQRLKYTECYPNATLAADWDLVEQIVNTIRHLPNDEISVQWVKGHQDETRTDLSVEAEFNIQADSLAGTYIPSSDDVGPHTSMVPAARSELIIHELPINSHYTQALREAYTLPALHEYMEQRYKWTSDQRKQVDWESFQQAARNTQISHVQLLKVIHNKLPTNWELAKSQPHQSNKCHYCMACETFHLLTQCDNQISRQFREDVFKALEEYMTNKGIPEDFQEYVSYSLRAALQGEEQGNVEKFPPTVRQCISEQLQLGQQSILQGFWTRTWRTLYIKMLRFYSLETPTDAVDFFAGILRIVWQEQLQLWENHLQHIHTSTTTPSISYQDKITIYKTQIRLLRAKRDQCLHGHRNQYFYPDVEAYLQTATCTQMRQYLHHYEKAINDSIRAAEVQPTRSLLTFPGFHQLRTTITQGSQTQRTRSNEPRGAPLHRNHTRWKPPDLQLPSIRKFFQKHPD